MCRLLLSIFVVLLYSTVSADPLYIYAGKLFNSKDLTLVRDRTIVVEGSKIIEVAKGFSKVPEGAKLIDLREHTLLPGFMDMHTHLSMQFSANNYIKRFVKNEADYAFDSVLYAKRTLMAGFTTVRDLGDYYNVTVALRKAIERGAVVGPRIFTSAKSIATTGGHADPTNGYRKDLMHSPSPAQGVVNGIAEAREAVRQRYKDGADLIKITATGGVLSLAKSGQNPQFMSDELEAIVATAKDYDMSVAVHAHGAEGMKRAIRAGVNSIEHGTYMDAEVISLMKKFGTFYVPTIMAGEWVGDKAKVDGFFPDLVRPKAATIGPLIQNTFARAFKSGVNIAFGTDSGVSPHGDNAREFVLMVEAGMSPAEAIQSATLNAARLLRVETELGTIAPGMLADIVAVKGDPLADISLLQNISFVMKHGEVFKR